jgi:hypothetical protein
MALVLLQQARALGWTPAETIEKGKALGLQVDGQLKQMVENYLSERR